MMKKLGFIGGGNMAEALISGLLGGKVFKPADLIASDIDGARRRSLKRRHRVDATASNVEVLRSASAVLLAVKPQNIDDVLRELAAAMRAVAEKKAGAALKSTAQ